MLDKSDMEKDGTFVYEWVKSLANILPRNNYKTTRKLPKTTTPGIWNQPKANIKLKNILSYRTARLQVRAERVYIIYAWGFYHLPHHLKQHGCSMEPWLVMTTRGKVAKKGWLNLDWKAETLHSNALSVQVENPIVNEWRQPSATLPWDCSPC